MKSTICPQIRKMKVLLLKAETFLVLSKTLLTNIRTEVHILVDQNVCEINICSAEIF